MCALCSLVAKAQQDSIELSNVTVTASLQAQRQAETGRNIVSIKGEMFRSLPVHSVDELLRYVPGIEVQQRGPAGAQSDIIIRGGTFQQVLVIIDGVKLNDPLTGHFTMNIPVNPDEIERIEVLKGAASAIWGSEAVGGVVNIITKTFSRTHERYKYQARAGFAAGEYGLLNGDASFHTTGKHSVFSAGLLTNNANGQPLRGTTGYFHNTTLSLSYSAALAHRWTLSARTAGDIRKFNAQNFYTTFASDTAHEKVNTWWSQLALQKKTNKGEWHIDAAYKKLRDQYWFTPGASPNDNHTDYFLTQGYYSGRLNKNHSYTAGLQSSRKAIRSNDRGNHSLWHGAAFVAFRHQLPAHFFINESLRLDWDERYGTQLVPQINLAWAPSRLSFRAAAGKSFRDADFTERYNNYNKVLVTSGRIGNPDLGPETSWNLEAGGDYTVSRQLKISGTFFYRQYHNLIDWVNTPYALMPRKINLSPTGTYALANNVAHVNTTGVELDVQYQKQLGPASSVQIASGFTWLHSKNDDPVPSFYISSHARYLVNYSGVVTVRKFSIGFSGIYKERNAQQSAAIKANLSKSYFTANLKVLYAWPHSGRLFVQADNLFNASYSDLLGAQMPGRWLSAGFEIALY